MPEQTIDNAERDPRPAMTIPEQAVKRYRVKEPELGDDLLSALRRPADHAALYAAASDAAVELEWWRALLGVDQTGWQPIKTAPKDGRLALVYRPLAHTSGDAPVTVKRLIGGNHHCWESTVPAGEKSTNPTDGACHVTHWMPIPAPPALVAEDETGVK